MITKMNMCFSVEGQTWLLVRKALLPGSTAGGRSTSHHRGAKPRHSKRGRLVWYRDSRAGGLGTGAQGQHLSARTRLWKAGSWQAGEMKNRPRALAFGTSKEEATSQARAQWGETAKPRGP